MEQIEAGSIKAGEWVTILRWASGTDRSWVGRPLEVIAVDLPFVVLKEHRGVPQTPFALNAKEVVFAKPNAEYLAALGVEVSTASGESETLEGVN